MKKTKIFLMIIVLALISGFGFSAKASGNYNNINGLGLTINVVTAKSGNESIKVGSPIFKKNFIENMTFNRMELGKVEQEDFSSRSISNLININFDDFSSRSNFLIKDYYSLSEIKTGFSGLKTSITQTYNNDYYYLYTYLFKQYSLSLPNYNNYSYYFNNLNDDYLSALLELKNGVMSYEDFFLFMVLT